MRSLNNSSKFQNKNVNIPIKNKKIQCKLFSSASLRELAKKQLLNTPVKFIDFGIKNLSFHDLTPKGTNLPISLNSILGLGHNFCQIGRAHV